MKKYFIFLAFLFLSRSLFAQDAKPKVFSKKVDFKGKTFSKQADFNTAYFLKETYFRAARFLDTADFDGAQFSKKADFYRAQFLYEPYFREDNFSDTADFGSTVFSKGVDFDRSRFLKEFSFNGAQCFGGANFNAAQFSKVADFGGDGKFAKQVDFSEAIFLDTVHFGSDFSKDVDFSHAQFSKEVDFAGARFGPKSVLNLSHLSLKDSATFNFYYTRFPDTILFADNFKLKNDIYFSYANYFDEVHGPNGLDRSLETGEGPIRIYLLNTNISKLHLDYIHFRLLLPDSTYDFNKVITYHAKAAIYEALLNNFKTNGQTESYKLLDIEYQEFKWQHNTWTKHFAWLPKWWWNFGYDKEYVFGWTIVFLLLFTCISYFFIYSLNTAVYPLSKIPVDENWHKKLAFKDFRSRFWYSFIYTSTIFFLFSLKVEKIDFKNKGGTFYLIAVYTIGLVCMAYMLNFVLQK